MNEEIELELAGQLTTPDANKLPEVPKYRLGRCVAHQECGCKLCHKAEHNANS